MAKARSAKQMLQSEVTGAFDSYSEFVQHGDESDLWQAIDYLDCLIERAQKLRKRWQAELREEVHPDGT